MMLVDHPDAYPLHQLELTSLVPPGPAQGCQSGRLHALPRIQGSRRPHADVLARHAGTRPEIILEDGDEEAEEGTQGEWIGRPME